MSKSKRQAPRITVHNVSYAAPDGTPILDAAAFTADGPSVALIGGNGSGKTTLLRLIAGELSPCGGTVSVRGRLGYLPQKIERAPGRTAGDLLGQPEIFRDLALAESGGASPAVLERLDGKWGLLERRRELLAGMGLSGLPLGTPLSSLSGGEVVRLALCGVLLPGPDILLLDEPTNNLDRASQEILRGLISEWRGLKIIATHDRQLLEQLDTVTELYGGRCASYRMRYPEYAEYRRRMDMAASQKVDEAEKHLAKDSRTLRTVMDRRGHQAASAERRARKDLGVGRVNLASGRNKGQTTTSRLKEVHLQRIAEARAQLKSAKAAMRPGNRIEIDIPQEPVPPGRKALEFSEVNFSFDGKPLWSKPLSFFLCGNSRMAVIGPNGAGKTTLLRLACGQLAPAEGTVSLSARRAVYLDQFLEYLDPGKTILENVWEPGSGVGEALIRTRLARLFFRRDTVHKKVECLSGGEKLRVALAKLFCVKDPPQLLLLDEPTNNLDLDSREQLESALAAFEGAILVISHDYKFLADIGAEDCLDLTTYSAEEP